MKLPSDYAVVIMGTDGEDIINGGAAADTIYGGNGKDNLYGHDGNDTLYGGAGNDSLYDGAGNDRMYGGDGNDVFYCGAGADLHDGGDGVDWICYSDSPAGVQVDLVANTASGGTAEGDTFVSIETLDGSHLNDILRANDADNLIFANFGDDVVEGRAGRDDLRGDNGNDQLFGGDDDDVIRGDAGNDLVEGGHGADDLFGGGGIDTLSYASSSAGVSINLATGAASGGDAFLDTFSMFENVTGSEFGDVLIGSSVGTAGNNVIQGLGGNDQLDGSGGVDRLDGGAGNDILTGGSEADTFVFTACDMGSCTPGYDTITDFQVGVDHLLFLETDTLYDLSFQEVGGNTVITYAHATGSITLTGVSLAQVLQHAEHDLMLG